MMLKISKGVNYVTFQNVILFLLITSGAIKPFFTYINAPFDWTLIIFILVVIDILFNLILRRNLIVLNKEKLIILIVLCLFYCLLLISLFYTPSVDFSMEKSYLFSINLLFFVYPLFIKHLNLNVQFKLFSYLLLPLAIWFVVFKTLYFSPLNSGYKIVNISFYEIRRNYLGFGMCLSILTILQIYLKKPFLTSIISFLLLIALGARGALIFLLITVIIWKWKSIITRILKFRLRRKVLNILGILTVLIPIFIFTQYERISNFMYLGLIRFQSLFKISSDSSVQGRLVRIKFALNDIFSSISTFLFGNGIGSFGILYSGEDVREYPHNIFLEILFELGIFALGLFLILLFLPFVFKREAVLKVLVLYFLLNALKSGDLVGLWLLFFFLGLLVFNPNRIDETAA